MKTRVSHAGGSSRTGQFGLEPKILQPSFLHLVTDAEVNELRQRIVAGSLPQDFEEKLSRLATRSMPHQFIAQNCRLFILLLTASYAGMFDELSQPEADLLLRVLAYVRKDEDAIPDYRPEGFSDDLRSVREVAAYMGQLLRAFKSWRLCHQVPRLWVDDALN